MPSPFPGMNPYLEHPDHWRDFHGSYLYKVRIRLGQLLRPNYVVRLEEDVYLQELPDDGPRAAGPRTPAATVAAPARTALALPAVEEVRQRRLEVRERESMAPVTVVELLSTTNKRTGPDREQYLTKRAKLLAAGVGFVELDLLRAGPRTAPGLAGCDYAVLVARRADLPAVDLWPVPLADPLPAVPVPLLPGDPEPLLDLQAAPHAVYDEVGYGDFIYADPPDPPLDPGQAAWAATFLPPETAR